MALNQIIQRGLEFPTFEFQTHLKTERFKVRFSNGRKFGFRMVLTIRKPNEKTSQLDWIVLYKQKNYFI